MKFSALRRPRRARDDSEDVLAKFNGQFGLEGRPLFNVRFAKRDATDGENLMFECGASAGRDLKRKRPSPRAFAKFGTQIGNGVSRRCRFRSGLGRRQGRERTSCQAPSRGSDDPTYWLPKQGICPFCDYRPFSLLGHLLPKRLLPVLVVAGNVVGACADRNKANLAFALDTGWRTSFFTPISSHAHASP